MRYTFNSPDPSTGLTVRIDYPSSISRQIIKDGKRVYMNDWDNSLQQYGEIKQTECGENRFIGVQNILEFYITAGCSLEIAPRDAIQTLTRLEWTLSEFFADGGTTKFVDRVSGALGIHASQIKIVSVYEGSVVVIFDVEVHEKEEDKKGALIKMKDKMTKKF